MTGQALETAQSARPGAATVAPRNMISYFWAKDAVDNAISGFRGGGTSTPETQKQLAELREAGRDEGVASNLLVRQDGGFSLLILWIKPHYPLPRHSHDSDCMYYMVSGSIVMGDRTLRAGDGFFVPRDCLYVYTGGPEGAELLEIRHNVDTIHTNLPQTPDRRFQVEMELVKANADRWKEMQVPPTFAANRAGG
jgi:hypothetical protein